MEIRTGHQIVAATNNQHKLTEIRPLIEPDFRILSLSDIGCFDELPETHNTLKENSHQKAAYVYAHYHIPCFADDTGLEVNALNGSPGVYSARYAGEHRSSEDNIRLLLANLRGVKNRNACFKTIITFIGLKETKYFEGILDGSICEVPCGSQGFGYDSVFQPMGFHQTLAEMTVQEKNKISHRGIAIQKLVGYLKNNFATEAHAH